MSSEKSLTPQIRFKGFTEAWEQRKLGELMEVTSVRRVHQDEWTTQGVRFLRARDLVAYANNTEIELPLYISKELYEKYTAQSGKVEIGDLLVTGVGTIGVPWLVETPSPVYFKDGNIIWFKNKNAIYGKYFYYAFTSAFIQNFIKESAGTGTVGTYTIDTGKKTPIYIPPTFEQHKIASAMKRFDSLITLHQRKLDALKKIKSALLEKMFPKNGSNVPEIRFTGFTEAWEQRKLSELTTMHARIGWQNLRTSEFLDSGNYYLITGTDFENGYVNLSTCHYVNKDRYDQDPNIQIDNGSILITKDGTLGKVALVQGLDKPATLNAGVFNVVIRNEKIVDNGYLYQYLKAPFLLNYVAQTATGGTIKHLNQSILVDFPVSMPSKGEQELIGDAFLRLDNLITLHQRKLDALKKIKSALLEKMFV